MNVFNNIFNIVLTLVFNTVLTLVFNIVFNIVLIVVSYFTNATTMKTRKFNFKWFYSFPPTSERTLSLLASLAQLNFLFLPFLTFS